MSLEEHRKKIDETDAQIVKLVAERIRRSKVIGKEKQKLGKTITDLSREEQVLGHVRALARKEKINEKDVESLYRHIIQLSKGVQGITVAFQGELGAYSEEAAVQLFSASAKVQPYETLDAVFKAVETGEVKFGVVPVENSLEGSINRSYDLMLNSSLKVCGETELRVVHCLIANQKATLDTVKKIYSHPQALGQAGAFLKHLNAELIPSYDTAGSVKMIKEMGILDGAAVAGVRAAEIYGMKILARGIEDNQNNFTRFFVLAREDAPATGKDKTSIVFSVKHKPGALFSALKAFSDSKVNLTKIESRPTRQRAWEYNFYLDFEGHREDAVINQVLEKVDKYCLFLKVLGSYPKAT